VSAKNFQRGLEKPGLRNKPIKASHYFVSGGLKGAMDICQGSPQQNATYNLFT